MNKIMAFVSCYLVAVSSAFAAEYVIDVPEGQVITNKVNTSPETSGDTFVKTGKGTYVLAGSMRLGYSPMFGNLEVREGTLSCTASSEIHLTAGSRVSIAAGATLAAGSVYTFGESGSTPDIEIAEGGVLDMKGQSWLGSTKVPTISGAGTIKGMGNVRNGLESQVAAQLANFTGTLFADLNIIYFNLGDNTAEHDVPISQMKGLKIQTTGYDRFRLNLQNALPATLQSVTGSGGYIEPSAALTIVSADVGEFSLHPYSDLVVRHGRIGFNSASSNRNDIDMKTAGITVTFADGTYAAMPTTGIFGTYNKTTLLAYPSGIPFKTSTESTLTLTNGACFRAANGLPKFVNVCDRSVLEMMSANYFVGGTTSADSPSVVFLDDGRLRLLVDAISDTTFGRSYNGLKVVVGAKGGEIRGEGDYGCPTVKFDNGVRIESAADTAGAVTFGGRLGVTLQEPLALAGDVTLACDSVWFANTANMRASSSVTGTGNLTLGNVTVSGALTAGTPLNLGTAPGTTLRVDGAASLNVGTSTGNRRVLGASDATSCPLSFAKGAALWLQAESVTTEFLDGTTSMVTVNGGMPMRGPLVDRPVFLFSKWNDIWGGTPWPLVYDAEKGFVEFKDYVNALTNGPDSVACIGVKTLSENATVAGLIVSTVNLSGKFEDAPTSSSSNTGNPLSATTTLKIEEGATLTVGGTGGPAFVVLNSSGDYDAVKRSGTGQATIKGAGTLNFGASEGYITCAKRGGGISCAIDGTAGVTLTGPRCINGGGDQYISRGNVFLAGHNTYSGGTRLSGMGARPYVNDAFGTGDVWLKGDGSGMSTGAIRIDEGLDLAFTNGFHLSGCGMASLGAVYAYGKVRFDGEVELERPTRVAVRAAEGEIRFAGSLSGDSLQVWNAATDTQTEAGDLVKAYDAVGKVVIDTADNMLTGKITVVRSTLKLADGASLGVDSVWLDDGCLEIEANGPVSLGAAVCGVGKVRLDGKANSVVTFPEREANPFVKQQECVLDLNNRNRVVNSLAGFTSVTNSGTKVVHLSVLDDAEGSFAGEVAENVVLHYGKVYTPGLLLILR